MTESSENSYGPHLMLDLCDCDPMLLDNLSLCSCLLDSLPAKIGMTKITPPYVFRYAAEKPEDSGITGIVIIAESHISLHTYPMKRFAFVDIFSCRPFDEYMAKEIVVDAFHSASQIVNRQDRGVCFPR